jgi:uncharacterized membrane protein YkoI
MFRQALFILMLCIASLSLPAQAAKRLALPDVQADQSMQLMHRQEAAPARIISREEAVRRARSEYPGKVLGVKLRGKGNFYAVKIIKNGKVRVVNVPAEQ